MKHLPDLTFAAQPALLRRLPALARAAWARHWDQVAPLLGSALPSRPRTWLAEALWVPALRFYARRQLAAWWEQERSREHLALLRSSSLT